MADQKISALTADTSPTSDDLVVTVDDPSGSPTNKKVALGDAVTKAHGVSDGVVKISSGAMTNATEGTDYYAPSGTDVAITDGGTGASTQQAALDAITNASSGTADQVLTTDGTNASWQDASGGGLSWGDSISGTTSPALDISAGDNTSAGSVLDISMTSTQSNAVKLIDLDLGSTTSGMTGIEIGKINTGNAGIEAYGNVFGSFIKADWIYGGKGIEFDIGGNTPTYGIHFDLIADNYNQGTRLLYGAFNDSQTKSNTAFELDLGTSTYDHVGFLINAKGASTGQRGIHVDLGSTGHGTAIEISGSDTAGGARVFEIDDNLTQASGTATGTTTKEIKITIGGVDYVLEAKSQA